MCTCTQVWDVTLRQERLNLVGHKDRVLSVSLCGDNSRVVSGSSDYTVKVLLHIHLCAGTPD